MNQVLPYLPEYVAKTIKNVSALYGESPDEIRLYRNGKTVLVIGGKNITTSAVCDEKFMQETVSKLCGHSLYAHADTIREGYIFTTAGFRVGVTGRAICRDNRVDRITDITSLCIRIPKRFPGTSDDIYQYATEGGMPRSILIWSPPGVGKTTALRELAMRLTDTESPYRTAVIDTRFELACGLEGEYLDVFSGYPRALGMEIAIRTMNPQFVICDEIAGEADVQAVLQCASSGTAVIASVHGDSADDLRRNSLGRLIDCGVFHTYVGLQRVNGMVTHTFHAEGEI